MIFSSIIYAATCGDTRVRKEIRDMSQAEWTSYKNAIKAMQQDGSYQNLAKIHVDMFSKLHGNYIFAQWHRIYLCKFEDEMRKHSDNPNIGIPYYAAWADSVAYGSNTVDKSPVWTEQYFGAGDGSCVEASNNTIFASQTTNVGGSHCITRQFDHSRGISGTESINNLQKGAANFKQFSDLLQAGFHAEPHLFISGDMANPWSVNDPIFFSHHASVDYVYDGFQAAHNDYNPNDIPDNSQQAVAFNQYTYGQSHANQVCCGNYQPYSGGQGFAANGTAPPTPPPSNSTNGTVVQNKPVSAADLAGLGIPASKVNSQNDWNNFKVAFANGTGASFVKDLLNNQNSSSVVPKVGKSSASIMTSSFALLAVSAILY